MSASIALTDTINSDETLDETTFMVATLGVEQSRHPQATAEAIVSGGTERHGTCHSVV